MRDSKLFCISIVVLVVVMVLLQSIQSSRQQHVVSHSVKIEHQTAAPELSPRATTTGGGTGTGVGSYLTRLKSLDSNRDGRVSMREAARGMHSALDTNADGRLSYGDLAVWPRRDPAASPASGAGAAAPSAAAGGHQGASQSHRISQLSKAVAWLESSVGVVAAIDPTVADRSVLPSAIDTRIARVEQAMAALEHRTAAKRDPAAAAAAAVRKATPAGSLGAMWQREQQASSSPPLPPPQPDSRRPAPSDSEVAEAIRTGEPVLLKRVLEKVTTPKQITAYPSWYFGKEKGSRGYFEHGPWATTADVNVTNDNFCGRNRAKVRRRRRQWQCLLR